MRVMLLTFPVQSLWGCWILMINSYLWIKPRFIGKSTTCSRYISYKYICSHNATFTVLIARISTHYKHRIFLTETWGVDSKQRLAPPYTMQISNTWRASGRHTITFICGQSLLLIKFRLKFVPRCLLLKSWCWFRPVPYCWWGSGSTWHAGGWARYGEHTLYQASTNEYDTCHAQVGRKGPTFCIHFQKYFRQRIYFSTLILIHKICSTLVQLTVRHHWFR